MNVSSTIVAKSDQLNADDLVGGPIVCKIERVDAGPTDEQPVAVHLEGRRPWYPCKTTRRVMVLCWGDESDKWVGQSVRLFRDPSVKFGGVAVGGIRISGMTGIDRAQTVCLASSKGKKSEHRIDVLKPAAPLKQSPTPSAEIRHTLVESELIAAVHSRLAEIGSTEADLRALIDVEQNGLPPPVAKWRVETCRAVLAKLNNGWGQKLRALAEADNAPPWTDADSRNPDDALPE